MSGICHDVGHLVFKRTSLPLAERQEVEGSIRFLYCWMSDRDFRGLLFLVDSVGIVGRAMAWVLVALGLNELRWKIVERLTGDY